MQSSLIQLKNYIERNAYRGYDPYDALKSPFFKLPILKKNKLIRFSTQQLVKRLPFSIRPLLFVPKGYNPVTLGLSIQAYAYLYKSNPVDSHQYLQKIDFLVKELENLIPQGFSGACWGYDFDWEARYAKIPAYQPTIVATGIITNALFVAYKLTNHQGAKELVLSASEFAFTDLNRTITDDGTCLSYSPFDKQQVFNASMKGVRLLAQANSIIANMEYADLAKEAVKYVINNQNEDGSWFYSKASTGKWVDNYHTGYVLDCMDEYYNLTDNSFCSENIQKGYKFYRNNFIEADGLPKFYHNKSLPVDCTSGAQTILTLTRFNDVVIASDVAKYLAKTMQKRNGSFKFRKFKYNTINTSFMRWSDAWMFCALAYLSYKSK